MRIIIANDHAAIALKGKILSYLRQRGHEVLDLGVGEGATADYPDMAKLACAKYLEGAWDLGVLLCGTGIGISIAANKIKGIRCALIHDPYTARMAKAHNNANFLAFGGRVSYPIPPTELIDIFMNGKFEGGERHSKRVAKLNEMG